MMVRTASPRLWSCLVLAALVFASPGALRADEPPALTPAQSGGNLEQAQQWLMNRFRRERRTDRYERRHSSVLLAFREVVADPAKSTVQVICDREPVALGTIVTANGYILTKASDLKGKIVCKMPDGRRLDAELIGVNKQHDLAALKVEADKLIPIIWTDQSELPVGSWLATPGLEQDAVSIGVLSATARQIAAPRPILGVLLEQAELGARIGEVMPGSGAQQANLKVGDVILGVNEEEIANREKLIERIGQFQPGDIVKLSIRRGEENLKIEAVLGPFGEEGEVNRHDFQNALGGALSKRRAGFPSVLQHDTVLQPSECGGVVVDLNGHAVGVNIARAGRVASYAIPASVAKEVLASLLEAKPVSLNGPTGAMH